MGNQHSFKVGPGDKPGTTKVELDGEDISHLTRGVTVTYEPAAWPKVELDLGVFDATTETGGARIHLAQGTRDLLVKFGWTPPPTEDPHAAQTCGFRWRDDYNATGGSEHQCADPVHPVLSDAHHCRCGTSRPGVVIARAQLG